MGRAVLVTGVSSDLGARFARALAAEPSVDQVVGVDVVPPRGDMGGVGFVRADIRNPVIAKVIAGREVDTVVHMSVHANGGGGRSSMKEHNVIGTMQLLAACQKAPGVERLVVKSSTAIYGSSSRDPAMYPEDLPAKRMPRTGFAKDMLEVEGYVRGFARRRPDVAVTMLRAANTVGPRVVSPLTQYFRLPVVPTVLGYDARLQFLHESDLLTALRHATLDGVHGTFNVAGDGVVMLSQAVRRLGRPTVAVPSFTLGSLGPLLRPAGLPALSPELVSLLCFGRGVDTTRMRSVLGFRPAHTSAEAFDDFARTVAPGLLPSPNTAAVAALGGGHA
ncbi:MAG: NAD-dependent epimerase/dehydratase family protein [Nocardioidaceae bacterium]